MQASCLEKQSEPVGGANTNPSLMFALFDVRFNLNGEALPSPLMCGWCDLIPAGAEGVIASLCPENVYFTIKIKPV